MLRQGLPAEDTERVGTIVVSRFDLCIVAILQQEKATMVSEVGRVWTCSKAKAKRDLGWFPGDGDEAIVSPARSLQKYDVVKA